MRYYHPFPEAIPLWKAGCSRVTHPSATMSIKQAQLTPFDLHVLGVPPAFVLSQDQTLHRVVSPIGFTRSEICLIANRSQLLLRFIVLSDFSNRFIESTNQQGFQFFAFYISHCSVFKMQFSSSFWAFLLKPHRQATYLLYHTFGSLSSLFFKLFSKFFWISLR